MMNRILKLNSSVESTAGAAPNARLLSTGEQEFGLTTSGVAIQAYKGTGFAKGTRYPNLRLMVPIAPTPVQFWTLRDSGINKPEDIQGKKFNISRPGSAVDIFARDLMRVTGLKPSQVTNLGHGQANRLIQDGLLDVAVTVGTPPHPAIAAIAAQLDVRVFGMGQAKWAQLMLEDQPQMFVTEIPGGIYQGNPDPIETISGLIWCATGANIPEDLAYNVTKTTFANKNELISSHKAWSWMETSNAKYAKIPLHPGAIRYYREQGIEIPKEAMP
jgi:TRAP transporter TAXI family solute receptor